ncbi:hypothetical protein SAMN04490243_0663 [Robiginitalea myxolifaciens]|uniref:Lipocalin-like domain-containing protein n=1 Tax=Robiginitalea myxolifaciens TaxID=400055 RepID=A0A1I6FTZ6_9FLAO|nr:hypothetical protein [Robiginitalea myxolifaciens]SFR33374.1 hypothetical protein SAMN04490243_0663 [Robiginitalea myxolifaciens]
MKVLKEISKLFLLSALLTSSFLMVSCSNDSGDDAPASIVGTWDARELRIDENTATEDELLAKDFLDILAAKDCYILSLTFNADGTAEAENSSEYLDLSGLATGNFDIPCPSQSNVEQATYTFENGQLTVVDAMGVTSTAEASVSGNQLILQLEGSVFDDVVSDGELVFVKR